MPLDDFETHVKSMAFDLKHLQCLFGRTASFCKEFTIISALFSRGILMNSMRGPDAKLMDAPFLIFCIHNFR